MSHPLKWNFRIGFSLEYKRESMKDKMGFIEFHSSKRLKCILYQGNTECKDRHLCKISLNVWSNRPSKWISETFTGLAQYLHRYWKIYHRLVQDLHNSGQNQILAHNFEDFQKSIKDLHKIFLLELQWTKLWTEIETCTELQRLPQEHQRLTQKCFC